VGSLYTKISFLEQRGGNGFVKSFIFSRHTTALRTTAKGAVPYTESVCHAWHRTGEVGILIPGIGGVEG
jgi:hypothetical protein